MINWLECAAKIREPVCFRVQCVLSTTSPSTSTGTTSVLNMEKLRLPSLETNSDSFTANRPWTYMGAIGPPTVVRIVIFGVFTHERLRFCIRFELFIFV
jgi:hypothetical protein